MHVYYTMPVEMQEKFKSLFKMIIERYRGKYDEIHFELDKEDNKFYAHLSNNDKLGEVISLPIK